MANNFKTVCCKEIILCSIVRLIIKIDKMVNKTSSAIALSLIFFAGILLISTQVIAQASRPTPNLSEMEKWYNISNITYDKYGSIKMDIVAKTDPPQTHRLFVVKYFDKSGIEVGAFTVMGVGYSTSKGQVEHVEVYGVSNDKINTIESVIAYQLNDDGTYTGPAREKTRPTITRPVTPPDPKPGSNNNINQSGECSFVAIPPPQANTAFSEALVKSALYERYSSEPNSGGLSSPLAVGISFVNIRLMDSYKNTVTVVPGRGAQRKHDGAPVNATVYRFHAIYIVCRKYNNTTRRTKYESDNVMFKASNGNWQSGVDSVPQIVEL